eukprot:1726914-Heterocapsa_arctica.AAC.1
MVVVVAWTDGASALVLVAGPRVPGGTGTMSEAMGSWLAGGGFASGSPLEHVLKGQGGVESTTVEDEVDIVIAWAGRVLVVGDDGGEVGDGVFQVELEH